MAFFISRQVVLNNLIRFKHSLDSSKFIDPQQDRIYKALLNYRTGDIHFSSPPSNVNEWKEIQLEVKPNSRGLNSFEVRNVNESPLDPEKMAPIAWRIMQETIQILNEITASSQPRPNVLPEKAAFAGLSDEDIKVSFAEIESIPGWRGQINRLNAEKMLEEESVGTYLLRNGDSFTEVIANRLTEANNMQVELFICTFVESEGKISDVLFLATIKGWTFYKDNPSLHDDEYTYLHSPEELLDTLGSRAQNPIGV